MRQIMIIGMLVALAAGLPAQPEHLKPRNFVGTRVSPDLAGSVQDFLPTPDGRLWVARGEANNARIWFYGEDDLLLGPLGERELQRPLLCFDPLRERVLALSRPEKTGAPADLFVLDPVIGPVLVASIPALDALAITFNAKGEMIVAAREGKRTQLRTYAASSGGGPLLGTTRRVLPMVVLGLTLDAKGVPLVWDDDEVWRVPLRGDAKPRQIFLAPYDSDAERTVIRSVVRSPFDGPGEGLIIATSNYGGGGEYLASSGFFGRGGRVSIDPFVTKLGFPIIAADFQFSRVKEGQRGVLHFASRSTRAGSPTMRFDSVAQQVLAGLPGSLTPRLEGRKVHVTVWGRPDAPRPLLLGATMTRPTGIPRVGGCIVDIDPLGEGYLALRDGMGVRKGIEFAGIDADGIYETSFDLPPGLEPGRRLWLQALILDPRAANGHFIVSNLASLVVPFDAAEPSARPAPPTRVVGDGR